MKAFLPTLVSVVLLLPSLSPKSSIHDGWAMAHETQNEQKDTKGRTATLFVPRFEASFSTEKAKLFAYLLPNLIKLSLMGNQYEWLEVRTDSVRAGEDNQFELSGRIADFDDFMNVSLRILSSEAFGTKNEIDSKSYRIIPDSILVQVERISRELAEIIFTQLPGDEEQAALSILICPFEFEGSAADSSAQQIQTYLASSLAFNFETMSNITRVEIRKNGGTAQPPADYDLLMTGSFDLREDSIEVSVTLVDARTRKELYTLKRHVEKYDIFSLPDEITESFENVVLVFPDVRDELLTMRRAKDFYERGGKYSADESDLYADEKAEVMYRKALVLDPNYIPALLGLAKVLTSQSSYEETIDLYTKCLAIDSLQVEAMLGLGEAYYHDYDSEDSLAVRQFEKAARIAKQTKNSSALASAYKWLGELASDNDDYDSAINYFKQALNIEKSDQGLWYGIANTYYQRYSESLSQIEDTTDIDTAVHYFRDGAVRFKNEPSFQRNLAFTLNYYGKVLFNAYLEASQNPTSENTDHQILYQRARKKLEEANLVAHNDHDLRIDNLTRLALLAFRNMEMDKAKALSRQAVELEPSDEWSYRLFAYLHNDSTHANEALEKIHKAMSISTNVFSYQVLGDIYLTLAKYDDAFQAFQNAKSLEDEVTSYTLNGLYKSARKSGKLAKMEPMLQEYLQQRIQKSDSVWAYTRLAETKREQQQYKNALEYLEKALEIASDHREAYDLLDSLYQANSFNPAQQLKIAILEKKARASRGPKQLVELAFAHLAAKQYKESLTVGDSALALAKTKADTTRAHNALAYTYHDFGVHSFAKNDSAVGMELMEKAQYHAQAASEFFPEWPPPLTLLLTIYHEYKINYEASYRISMKLLSLDSLNTSNITNSIEAMLTAGRFEDALNASERILSADLLAKKPLNVGQKLAMRFILMAANVLKGNLNGAHAEFGGFQRDYMKLSTKTESTWLWHGTKRFLKTYSDLKPSHRELLLNIIDALESEEEPGLTILDRVESNWGELLGQSKN